MKKAEGEEGAAPAEAAPKKEEGNEKPKSLTEASADGSTDQDSLAQDEEHSTFDTPALEMALQQAEEG